MENEGKVEQKILFEPSKYWKSYLLIGVINWELLPFLLQTIIFVGQKNALSATQTLALRFVAKVISMFFIGLFLVFYMKEGKNKYPEKKCYVRLWKDIIWMITCIAYIKYVPLLVLQYGSLYYPKVSVVASFLLFVLGAVFLTLQTSFTVMNMQPVLWKQWKEIVGYIKSEKGILFATFGILVWCLAGDYILLQLTSRFIMLLNGGYSVQLASVLIHSVLHGIVLVSYFSYVRKSVEHIIEPEIEVEVEDTNIEENVSEEKKYKIGGKWSFSDIVTGIITAIIGVALIINSYGDLKANKKEDIQAYMSKVIMDAREELEDGNADAGNRKYVKAKSYMTALDFYADKNERALKELVVKNPSDEFYWQLYYAYTQDIGLLKQRIIKQPDNMGLYHELLNVYVTYKGKEEWESFLETEEEKAWIDLCIQKCLDAGRFQADYICIDDESLKKANIIDLHHLYDEELSYNDLMIELANTGMKGSVDKKSVNRIFDMADENKENMVYQLTAIEYGVEYVKNDKSYYTKTVAFMKRYDDLYSKSNATKEEMIEVKLYLTEIMLGYKDYKNALELLKPIEMEENDEIKQYIIRCYEGLGRQEQLAEYVEKFIKNGTATATEYYYAALSCLKMKKIEQSLSYGINLADRVVEAVGEEKENNNKLLNSYVQYLCINDSLKKYVQYKYSVGGFSETQLEMIKKSPLLEAYIEATRYFYNEQDYEKAQVAVEKIDELCPDMSMTWLLRGNIYYDIGDYDKAIECFENCLQMDPYNLSAEYSMLTLYESLEEYEKAYELCNRILEKTTHVKLEEDWYGIIYYTEILKEKLSPYVAEEKL